MKPKDIVILGTGAIGSAMASFLQLSNEEGHRTIHLVGRGGLVARIAREGLLCVPYDTPRDEWIYTTHYKTYTTIREVPRADVLFLTVKAHALVTALEEARPLIEGDEPPIVVIMMNGLGLKEVVSRYAPADRLVEAIANYPADLDLDGSIPKVVNTGGNDVFVFEQTPLTEEIVPTLLSTPRVNTRIAPNFAEMQWKKAIMNISMNAIAAMTVLAVGEVAQRDPLRRIVARLIQETVAVARREGVVLEGDMATWFWGIAANDPHHMPSMVHDMRQHKPTEVEFMNGYIARRGEMYGIATPANDAITDLVRIIEGRS
jgi:2-dehydropantoate 2-reductase